MIPKIMRNKVPRAKQDPALAIETTHLVKHVGDVEVKVVRVVIGEGYQVHVNLSVLLISSQLPTNLFKVM